MMVNVSVSPHVRSQRTTASVMGDVAIALIPALAVGVFVFGLRALIVIALSVCSCIVTEYAYEKLMKRPVTVGDNSALVTGLILAVNLPSTVPWWIPVMGGVFAILFVKQLFGGLGQNIMNPALAARCFLIISFPAIMGGNFPLVSGNLLGAGAGSAFWHRLTTFGVDGVASATPLALDVDKMVGGKEILNGFLGLETGCIGEISAAAILLGGIYLVIRRVISPRIPCVYIGSTVAFIALMNLMAHREVTVSFLLMQLVSGGLMAGAVFMATDYVTSPVTRGGQWLYALLLGLLTALFRTFGASAEGVSYAIIIGNTVAPLLEKVTLPRPFGVKRGGAGK